MKLEVSVNFDFNQLSSKIDDLIQQILTTIIVAIIVLILKNQI